MSRTSPQEKRLRLFEQGNTHCPICLTEFTEPDVRAGAVVTLEHVPQESLVKGGVNALRVPVYDLMSNRACMMMAALAWNLKSRFAMMMHFKADRRKYIAMEFRTFNPRDDPAALPGHPARPGARR